MTRPEDFGAVRLEDYEPEGWYQEYREDCEEWPNSAERLMRNLRGRDMPPALACAINDFLRDVAVLIDAHATHDA